VAGGGRARAAAADDGDLTQYTRPEDGRTRFVFSFSQSRPAPARRADDGVEALRPSAARRAFPNVISGGAGRRNN
jgi:hypothetical protein